MFQLFLIFFSLFLPLAVIFYARLVGPHKKTMSVCARFGWACLILIITAMISLAIPISLKIARDPYVYEQYYVGKWLPFLYVVMTFVCIAFVCLVLRDLIWAAATVRMWFASRKQQDLSEEDELKSSSRREFLRRTSTLATVGGAVLLTPVSVYRAGNCRIVKRLDIKLRNFPASLNGLKIVHLSDIHLGNTISENDIAAMVRETNALNPDLIAITGDMADGMPEHIGSWLNPMKDFKAKYGVWFVTGNHDHLWDAQGWCSVIENLGIHVLNNRHEIVRMGDTEIAIAGAIDAFGDRWNRRWKSSPEMALKGIKHGLFRLMLVHQPSSVDRCFALGADLVLLGHTHGGQCWPLNYVIDAMHKYSRGLYLNNGRAAFVSSGTGYWGPPLRIGIPPEICVLTLYHEA